MSIEVQTTQNVVIDYEPAGIGLRLLAWFIDIFILFLWCLAIIGLRYISIIELSRVVIILGLIIPILVYHLLFELFNRGQTPGKMIAKIRVISLDGSEPSVEMYIIRWLFRVVEITTNMGGIAIISIMVSKNSQRIGDLIAKTTVISLRIDESEQLFLSNLDFHEDYKVTYYDILFKLSDKDIRVVQTVLNDDKNKDLYLNKLAEKIKSITGYNYEGKNIVFLRKIVSDYNYLASQ